MPTTLNRPAVEKLIAEDIEWLKTCPKTLERIHIEAVLDNWLKITGEKSCVPNIDTQRLDFVLDWLGMNNDDFPTPDWEDNQQARQFIDELMASNNPPAEE